MLAAVSFDAGAHGETITAVVILALTDASRLGKCRLGRRMLLGCCSQLTALPGIGCYHY